MSPPSFQVEDIIDYRPCWEEAEVQQVVQGLARISGRQGKAIVQRRRCDRKSYTARILITQHSKGRAAEGPRMMLQVTARNLSRSGIGLLAPLFFEAEIPTKTSPMLRSANIFREGSVIELGLLKQSGSLLWLIGSVVRARTVQNDFLEIGICFCGRKIQVSDFGV